MDFLLADLMDQDVCYAKLVGALHPDGLACPRCGGDRFGVHRRHSKPVLDYRCKDCRRVFNAFTGTALQKSGRSPASLILVLRGIAQAVPTAWLARELDCDRMKPLQLGYKLQEHVTTGLDSTPLADPVVDADECCVNAREKRHPARRAG